MIGMRHIQNIIFDLGGVIINLDYKRTAGAFRSLGIGHFDEIYSKAKQNNLFDLFEKGLLREEEFRDTLKLFLPGNTSDEAIDQAWNAMLLDIPPVRVEWLRKVAGRYRIFLLSNTNSIHIRAFTGLTDELFGPGLFESIFEKHYYSCQLGMRKPDAEIFEFVLDQNKLEKEATLFIDDSIQHVEGARKLGLPAELLNVERGEKLEERFAFFV